MSKNETNNTIICNIYPDRDSKNTILCFGRNTIHRDLKTVFKDIAGEQHFSKMFPSFGYAPSLFLYNSSTGDVLGFGIGRNNDTFIKSNIENLNGEPRKLSQTDFLNNEYDEEPVNHVGKIQTLIEKLAYNHYEIAGPPEHEWLSNCGAQCENCEGEGCDKCEDEGYTIESLKEKNVWSTERHDEIARLEELLRDYFPNMSDVYTLSPCDW